MSLSKLSFVRAVQPIFVRTAAKTSTTGTTTSTTNKKPQTPKKDEESFLDDATVEEVIKADTEPATTGRERSLNRIQLIGRVGGDPKVGGTERHKVVTFNIATNEYAGTNTQNGEIKQRVDWHRIAVFQPRLLDNAEKYVRQGDRLYVQGRLHHNRIKDKQSGEDRYVTSIIADDMIFLNKK